MDLKNYYLQSNFVVLYKLEIKHGKEVVELTLQQELVYHIYILLIFQDMN
jgi:hypothetical protein